MLAIPPIFNAAPYRYLADLGACAPEFRTGNASVFYAAGYTVFTLLIPATVFICCNAKVSAKVIVCYTNSSLDNKKNYPLILSTYSVILVVYSTVKKLNSNAWVSKI